MKLKDAREAYYFHTGKASDIVRQLSLGGIAVIWLFRVPSSPTSQPIPHDLVVPGILVMGSLAADLLQYAVGAAIWGIYSFRKERAGTDPEDEFLAPDAVNWATLVLFWVKVILVIAAYVLIILFLKDVVLPAPAPSGIPQLRSAPS